jgi:hypothetical protein
MHTKFQLVQEFCECIDNWKHSRKHNNLRTVWDRSRNSWATSPPNIGQRSKKHTHLLYIILVQRYTAHNHSRTAVLQNNPLANIRRVLRAMLFFSYLQWIWAQTASQRSTSLRISEFQAMYLPWGLLFKAHTNKYGISPRVHYMASIESVFCE